MSKRTWKKFPELEVFEEGYRKDYIFEKGRNIPLLNLNNENKKTDINLKLITTQNKKYKGSPDIILLTMRGAIKFNMWKRTEGGKMIADALKILNSI